MPDSHPDDHWLPPPVAPAIPDPTAATINLVRSALQAQKDLFLAKEDIVKVRLDAMDRAVELLGKYPTDIDVAIESLRKVFSEKFEAVVNQIVASTGLNEERIRALTETISVFKQTVNERFQLGDIQTEKAARDVKSAVDAAFAAAKEAVGEQNKSNALSITKSEAGFTKQIDQLASTVTQIVKNTDDKISDLKERVLASEGKTSVSDPATARALGEMAASIASLKTGESRNAGRTQQADEGWKGNLSIISVLIALGVALFEVFSHRG
jgi:hypothetical protein